MNANITRVSYSILINNNSVNIFKALSHKFIKNIIIMIAIEKGTVVL